MKIGEGTNWEAEEEKTMTVNCGAMKVDSRLRNDQGHDRCSMQTQMQQ